MCVCYWLVVYPAIALVGYELRYPFQSKGICAFTKNAVTLHHNRGEVQARTHKTMQQNTHAQHSKTNFSVNKGRALKNTVSVHKRVKANMLIQARPGCALKVDHACQAMQQRPQLNLLGTQKIATAGDRKDNNQMKH